MEAWENESESSGKSTCEQEVIISRQAREEVGQVTEMMKELGVR